MGEQDGRVVSFGDQKSVGSISHFRFTSHLLSDIFISIKIAIERLFDVSVPYRPHCLARPPPAKPKS